MGSFATRATNYALYQTGWFLCIIGAGNGYPNAGALAAFVLVAAHVFLTSDRGNEIKLLLIAGAFGVVIDGFQQFSGLLHFAGDEYLPLPLWVVAIWVQFATLLRFCLNWLQRRYLQASVFGFLGGPLAYLAGVRFEAATMPNGALPPMIYIAVVWSIALPLLVFIREKIAPTDVVYGFAKRMD